MGSERLVAGEQRGGSRAAREVTVGGGCGAVADEAAGAHTVDEAARGDQRLRVLVAAARRDFDAVGRQVVAQLPGILRLKAKSLSSDSFARVWVTSMFWWSLTLKTATSAAPAIARLCRKTS